MRVYLSNGTVIDPPFCNLDRSLFYIQKLTSDEQDKYIYPGDSLFYELDSQLVELYDKFRDLFFPDTKQYYDELDFMPIFVQSAGQDSDCALSSEQFSLFLQNVDYSELPNINRHLYLVDCQYLIGTIQNLLMGMEDAFIHYFIRLPLIQPIIPLEETNTKVLMQSSVETINLSCTLENYFVKAYSILDMLCKIAFEIQRPQESFSEYKKLKSTSILWGNRKQIDIQGTTGTVFDNNDLIRKIESIRNEIVHNGTWELRPKVFIRTEKCAIVERFMLFPDFSQGHLATVKNRRHFFGSGIKVNEILPIIHQEYRTQILNTVKHLNNSGS